MKVFDDMQHYLQECVSSCGDVRLYGCEMVPGTKGNTLRIFIENDQGTVSADDCQRVGVQIRNEAAVSFPSILNYRIEISSPGLDRILFSLAHCARHLHQKVKCKTKRAIEGRKNYTGVLSSVSDDSIILVVDNQTFTLSWHDIEKVRLIYEPE